MTRVSAWTDEMVDALRILWSEGKAVSEIAIALNRKWAAGLTRNSVIGKAHRIGLAGRPSPLHRTGSDNHRATGRSAQSPPNPERAARSQPEPKAPRIAVQKTSPEIIAIAHAKRAKEHALKLAALDANGTHGRASAALGIVQALDGCRWPVGATESPQFHFCGELRERHDLPFVVDPKPYCQPHGQKAVNSKVFPNLVKLPERVR